MPFILPALPHIIGAASTIGAGALGSKLSKSKPSPLEQQQLDRSSKEADLSLAERQRGSEMSRNLFDMGQPAVQQPLNYWASILSGDRSRMTSAMGPELSRIGEGYQQAGQTLAALNPRGGPTPDFLSQQPYNQQRDVSTMFQQARPQAAQQSASTGSNLLANAINSLYGSTAGGQAVLNFEQQRRQRDREAGASIGGSIYDIFYPAQGQGGLASILGDIFKGGAKTSGSTQNFNIPSPTSMRG